MRAALVRALGPPKGITVTANLPSLTAKAGEVVIAVKACGLNFADVLSVQGLYQIKPPLPFAPGGEVAGTIKQIGPGVSGFKLHEPCLAFCGYGGLADEVCVKESSVFSMPSGMDFTTASGFVVAYQTAYYALKSRAQLKQGETVLVLGAAGGCGLAACQLAKAMGAHVIAAASTAEKRQTCIDIGQADAVVDPTPSSDGKQNLRTRVKSLAPKGINVVFDTVGGELAEQSIRSMATYGRYTVIGFASGEIPTIPLNLLLLKQVALIGVFMGSWFELSRSEFNGLLQELGDMYKAGAIKPYMSGVYPLERTAEALMQLQERKAQGKIVVSMETDTSKL